MDVATAFAIFCDSFTLVPSRRSISTRGQAGPLLVVHSDYLWQGARRVTDDFFIHGCSPAEALEAVRAHGPEPHHYLLVVDEGQDALGVYEAEGYRLAFPEYLMARRLDRLLEPDGRYAIQLVQSADAADRVNSGDAEVEPWVRPANLADPALSHYCLEIGGATAARARNWQHSPRCGYVTHVFTHPEHRRRGLARAVMLRLLHDSAARGASESALVASEEGALLYASLGYERLARLLVLAPAGLV
ncbi:MAG: GNAT family N-acetyltransferase [Chloroflexi bacterium]|nr:GNAT family N-acetyltransferase [Chloroflexota bacterium]